MEINRFLKVRTFLLEISRDLKSYSFNEKFLLYHVCVPSSEKI